jgi:CheY-like chemotaxis protein
MKQNSTILIIEENQSEARSLEQLCRNLGLRPVVAHDGMTGLQLAAAEKPRLILSDTSTPGFDGFEAVRRLRRDQTLIATPIIAVTGQPPKAAAANQVSFDDYVLKPITSDNFQQLIAKFYSLS